ncbi:ABC transporter permease [Spongisporangium articulatum]|uniref:ABC transporter permease n=1 Tax=Spongisporangium articulatum TaxID=3362603 RepID=A0ABW8AJ89_9ACTN
MNVVITYLQDSTHWSGEDGIPHRLVQHVEYSLGALLVVLVIALPLGLYIGHTGRGSVAIAGMANALRALPSYGLLVLVVVWASSYFSGDFAYLGPALLVLVVLGVPAVLSNTYAGVENVDPAVRDAARGMGMTGWQVLWRVEVPNALPLIISGVRSAVLQIVATATVAASVTLGGLGRLILDGLQQQDYGQMAAGALLVAVMALALDLVLALVQRLVVSRGVSGRYRSTASVPSLTAAGGEGVVSAEQTV